MFSKTILIVEDNDILSEALFRLLGAKDYHVVTCPSVEKALHVMRSLSPSLFLLDINLPGVNGIELCQHLRTALRKREPIVFLTSSNDKETIVSCFEAGGDDYMLKTSRPNELVKRVEYWINEAINIDLPEVRQAKLDKLKAS